MSLLLNSLVEIKIEIRPLCLYLYKVISTDDWVRPMKHFVLEEIYI